jgi:hypothetical protein
MPPEITPGPGVPSPQPDQEVAPMDELALALRAAHDVEPAARYFAKAFGDSRLRDLLVDVFDSSFRYRWAPYKARLLMRAAEKVRESGLPPQAMDDRLLFTVLEHGGFEEDADMQERWASLLANSVIGTAVPPALPEILRQLEPVEARFLDRLFDADELCVLGDIPGYRELQPRHLENLQRLGLLKHDGTFLPYGLRDRPHRELSIDMTQLGASLVIACRSASSLYERDSHLYVVHNVG